MKTTTTEQTETLPVEQNIGHEQWVIRPTSRRTSKDRYDIETESGISVATYVDAKRAPMIAAAPELLEACEDLLHYVASYCDKDDTRDMRVLACDAIAKAKGK